MNTRIRIEQTRREKRQLSSDVQAWLDKRRKADEKLKQYNTQLNVLGALLQKALDDLESSLSGISAAQVRSVYSECRVFDLRLAWVRRIWEYFRSKFDQRDDGRMAQVLAVADEVVWSCYAEVYQNIPASAAGVKQGSAPLPYIEPGYSPQAVPRYEPPKGLKSDVDEKFIADYLNELPIPVVSLPSSCLHSPWWLVLLGHEVGHHVQYDLLPDRQMVSGFRELLETIVGSASEPAGDARDKKRWGDWGREIFADLFSIFNMGPWAIRAMAEMETGNEASMLSRKTLYPSPVVRLALMAKVASKLGLDGQAALGGLSIDEMLTGPPVKDENDRDLREMAREDMRFVEKIASSLWNSPLKDAGALSDLCAWNLNDFLPGNDVAGWAEAFREQRPLHAEESLRAARAAICGLMSAWAEISEIGDDEEREKEMARLGRKDVLETIARSREAKTRAAAPVPEHDVLDLGEKLARLLIDAGPQELGL